MRVALHDFTATVRDCDERIATLTRRFRDAYRKEPRFFVSAPGRVELIGNHTDHNRGIVAAASIDLDALAVVSESPDGTVRFFSSGWKDEFVVSLTDTTNPAEKENDTVRLVRGIAEALRIRDVTTTGFTACIESRVKPGSGLSSSAAIESLLAEIFLFLADRELPVVEHAKAGKYAENEYMGKPSGLMDQVACSHGGAVAIDFGTESTRITPLSLDLEAAGLQMVIVDSGGDHANLTPAYSAIPAEMKSVAGAIDTGNDLRATSEEVLISALPDLRSVVGDRALLRSLHFFRENERVRRFVAAVNGGDTAAILRIVNESGSSSWRLLQNVETGVDATRQPLALALALTEGYLASRGYEGAARVHGGGFAGTILAIVPTGAVEEYCAFIDRTLGSGAAQPVSIRERGVISAPTSVHARS